ncbi:hypothetical protein PsYK624_087970 [Phanerochaete sordida]|uniref:Uncharacterized protein n=1 Tax=Phanerochaete sordida TaxID=48140 RepID=A0A9P3GDD7_9APHY|nr:hypothetical protein PsYK624_087970 [Phanerochaete sordida]
MSQGNYASSSIGYARESQSSQWQHGYGDRGLRSSSSSHPRQYPMPEPRPYHVPESYRVENHHAMSGNNEHTYPPGQPTHAGLYPANAPAQTAPSSTSRAQNNIPTVWGDEQTQVPNDKCCCTIM